MCLCRQPSLANEELTGWFCPDLTEGNKGLRNNHVSSALAKLSSWVQKKHRTQRHVLSTAAQGGAGNPPFLSPSPKTFLVLCLEAGTHPQHRPGYRLGMDRAEGLEIPALVSEVLPRMHKRVFSPKTSFENVFSQGKIFVKLLNLSQDVLYELQALLN